MVLRCPVDVWRANHADGEGQQAAQKPLSAEELVEMGRNLHPSTGALQLVLSNRGSRRRLKTGAILEEGSSQPGVEGARVKMTFTRNMDLLGEALATTTTRISNDLPFNSTTSSSSSTASTASDNQPTSVCHYESFGSGGHAASHSALSICSPDSITGFLRLGSSAYILSHDQREGFSLESATRGSRHMVDSPDFKEAPAQSAQWELCDEWLSEGLPKRAKRAASSNIGSDGLPNYYKEFVQDGMRRYVELALIADHSIYKKYGEDEKKIHDRLHAIANVLNSLYYPLNIRVTLVWADIWKEKNPIEVSTKPDVTLSNFLLYRKGMLEEHPHDNAHLITDTQFGSVIGKAYKGTMCSYDYSGGVNVDHSESAANVARTVAHEMGHNFGMDHDGGYPEPCKCGADSCIMSPSSISGLNFTAYFSDCSLDALDHALRRNVDYCLRNVPKSAFGGAQCGNGVLEEGEECDCGRTDSCPNRCCVASKCKLAADARCAEGECCDTKTCKPKRMATPCRPAEGPCDLPEYCDGRNPVCPPDFLVQNGLTCPGSSPIENSGDAEVNDNSISGISSSSPKCYEGVCGSRDQQCRYIWGPSAHSGVAECYAFNSYGSVLGNCGYEPKTDRYSTCRPADLACGRLHCEHESDRPMFGNPATVHTAVNYVRLRSGQQASCKVIRTTYTGSKRGQPDPGMVPDGAGCGAGRMCVRAECRNSSEVLEMVSKCEPANCNNKGVCNNMGNCHCDVNYGGIACDVPGFGGSVNSGPASDHIFNPSLFLLYLLAIALACFIAATYYCRRKHNCWLHKEMWRKVKRALSLEANLRVPTRMAPLPPGSKATIVHYTANGRTRKNSFSAAWGETIHHPQHAMGGKGGHDSGQARVEVLRVGANQAFVPTPLCFSQPSSQVLYEPVAQGGYGGTNANSWAAAAAAESSSSSSSDGRSPPQPPPHRSLLPPASASKKKGAMRYEEPPPPVNKVEMTKVMVKVPPKPPIKPPIIAPAATSMQSSSKSRAPLSSVVENPLTRHPRGDGEQEGHEHSGKINVKDLAAKFNSR